MEILLKHCTAVFSQHGSLFITFFLAGLTGSITHCLSMCGPIVACHTMCQSGACSTKQSLFHATQLSYHIGRATSYGLLGFIAALLARQVAASPWWPWLASAMLGVAGVMFLISSFTGCKHALHTSSGKITYLRGILLGFLPCGLLYAALMMAATTADPFSGMVAMWFFVAGTLPALMITSAGAHFLTQKWQSVMQKSGRVIMGFNGLSLLVMAEQLVR